MTIIAKEDTFNKAISGILKRFSQTSFFNSVLKQLTILYRKSKIPWNSDLNITGFDNGVYDTNTYTFRNAKSEEYINITMGYA